MKKKYGLKLNVEIHFSGIKRSFDEVIRDVKSESSI